MLVVCRILFTYSCCSDNFSGGTGVIMNNSRRVVVMDAAHLHACQGAVVSPGINPGSGASGIKVVHFGPSGILVMKWQVYRGDGSL